MAHLEVFLDYESDGGGSIPGMPSIYFSLQDFFFSFLVFFVNVDAAK